MLSFSPSKLGAALLALVAIVCALQGHARAQTAPFYGLAQPTNIPFVIQGAGIVQPAASQQPDPGASFVTTYWRAVDYNQEPLVTGTCTTNASICYGYESFAFPLCNTTTENTVWNAMTEPMFSHIIGGGITLANRVPNPNNPGGTTCPQPGGGTNGGVWNPAATNFASLVNTTLAANRPTLKLWEDNGQITGQFISGSTAGAGWQTTTEYGMGQQGGNTWVTDQAATNAHAQGVDYDTAIGQWISGVGRHVWINGLTVCCGDPTGCTATTLGECHDPLYAGGINNAWAIHNIGANAGGNLDLFMAENPLLHKYNPNTTLWSFANSVSITWFLNTISQFYRDPVFANTYIAHFEYGSGTGGPGDLAGSPTARQLFAAFNMLVANPSTSMPDKVIPMFAGISCSGANPSNPTNNPCVAGQVEIPYFFEQTGVPVGAQQAVAAYHWGGASTIGGGCPTAQGDTGGAIALLVQCVSSAGIYCNQYSHYYFNAVDKGPVMACVNTSSTAETILSGWAIHDPISSYHFYLSLNGCGGACGDLTSIPHGGGSDTPGCTYTVVCNDTGVFANHASAFVLGTTQIPGPGGIILMAKGT